MKCEVAWSLDSCFLDCLANTTADKHLSDMAQGEIAICEFTDEALFMLCILNLFCLNMMLQIKIMLLQVPPGQN